MSLPFVQKKAGVTERPVCAQGTAELLLLGVLAVFMVVEGLFVLTLVAAVLAMVYWHLVVLRMLGLLMLLQLIFALAGETANFTDQGLALVA